MSTKDQSLESNSTDGAANLIGELNKIFDIYTAELKSWREGNGKGQFLLDSDMFDVVIKLLDKSDKILKLSVKPTEENSPAETSKIRNIQDLTLSKSK